MYSPTYGGKCFWFLKIAENMETIKWRLSKALRDVNILPTWEALVSKVHKSRPRQPFLQDTVSFMLSPRIQHSISKSTLGRTYSSLKSWRPSSINERNRFHWRNSNGTTNNRTLFTRFPQQLSISETNNPWVTIQSISIHRINPSYMLFEQHSNTSINTSKQNNQLSPTGQ